ncbi:hypothetical protein GPJ56_010681 [Histomonas meleagridis]|uniref:uncharacterized protein n=1 Tax=Histomonas meleagridis TaxID=135588 RepID=UPI00355A4C6F|nr:hypothetical protein GPJ56_010681 [Histomonas meleagridis]KAH0801013.1 hypothetical protein GO595_006048 [Histomonas meleagridis]
MGCSSSRDTRVTPQKTIRLSEAPSTSSRGEKKYNPKKIIKEFHKHFVKITSEIQAIKCPEEMHPPLCIGEDAYPILLSPIYLESNEPVNILMPIVSISYINNVRIMCISQIQFLSLLYFDSCDTFKFISSCLVWLSRGNRIIGSPILFYRFPEKYSQDAKKSFYRSGIKILIVNTPEIDFSPYQIIFIPSNIELDSEERIKLKSFINSGGGLFCFYCPVELFPTVDVSPTAINDFLIDYGLSFSCCKLAPNPTRKTAEFIYGPDRLIRHHLLYHVKYFCDMMESLQLDEGCLDDTITALRYYIIVCDNRHLDLFIQILDKSWSFLNATNFVNENGIGEHITQSLVIVLMCEVLRLIPPQFLTKNPLSKTFPGETLRAYCTNYKLDIKIRDESWISTGLWLPAGQTAIIKCLNPPLGLHVQIGSHNMSLLSKQGPWNRWPEIVNVYIIDKEQITVGSSFGGIVYVYFSFSETECRSGLMDETDQRILIEFEGFSQYPRYVYDKPEVFMKTKEFEIPWAEITTKTFIITLPTKMLMLSSQKVLNELCNKLDEYVITVTNYMEYKIGRKFRLVFDCEDSNNYSYGYPIILHLTNIDDIILKISQPSLGIFNLIRAVAVLSLREGYFDPETEVGIGTLIAAMFFKKMWPDFDMFSIPGIKIPQMFEPLSIIQTKVSQSLITSIIRSSQKALFPYYELPEDMWVRFVRELCNNAKMNLTPMLRRYRPIPISVVNSLSNLPQMQPILFA